MPLDEDPFADAPEDRGPYPIAEGATVTAISRHPLYGVTYRCNGWMAHYPWSARVGAVVRAYRGDPFAGPEPFDEARAVRLRRNGAEFKEIAVGFDGAETEFDVVLDSDLPIEVGDTLTFGDH